ncbi:MAG TPA: putative Ig domain-containing protein, partial [Pirellulaceae bacterium]|nr:putative Ig domain-containing protein [Pirellulaceae bacterium]
MLRAFDFQGAWSQQEFIVSVVGGNHAPTFASTAPIVRFEGDTVARQYSASDVDGDALHYWATELPGEAVFDPSTRALYWKANVGAAGTYRVRLHVSDGKTESTLTQEIEVRAADVGPTLQNPGVRILREGDAVRMQLHATDPNGDAVTFSASPLPPGATLHPLTGDFEWTPEFDSAGRYEITFTAKSGGKTDSQTAQFVVLNANGAPEFDPVERWRSFEGQEIVFRVFAHDPDNPTFVAPSRIEGELVYPTTTPTVALTAGLLPDGATFDAESGLFRWTPDYLQAGEYQVSFTATDDGNGTDRRLSAQLTVPISVRNLNRRPEIPPAENVVVQQGESQQWTVRVTDPDGDVVHVALVNGLTGRVLPDFITYVDEGAGVLRVTVAPGAGVRGDFPLVITAIDDGDGDGSWARLDSAEPFVLTVDAENDPPHWDAVPDRVALSGRTMTLNVRAADLDEESLSYAIAGLPGATIAPGTRYGTARITWTPTTAQIGSYTARLTVTDDGADGLVDPASSVTTFRVIVRATNATPTFPAPGRIVVTEGQPLSYAPTASDLDGDSLWFETTASLPEGLTLNAKTGTLTWTPTFAQAGSYNIPITVSDGVASVTRTLLLDVLDANQRPVIVPIIPQYVREGSSIALSVVAGDPDGDALALVATQLPLGATFEANTGVFRWTPTFTQAGEYRVRFTARDGRGGEDSYELPLRVDEVNRAPELTESNHSGAIGRLLEFSLRAADADVGSTLRYSAVSLPYGATLDETTGKFRWTPGPAQAGDYVVRFIVDDGMAKRSQNVLLTVASQISAPSVNIDVTPGFAVAPGQSVSVRVTASSLDGIAQLTLDADGRQVALDSLGRATFTPRVPGRIRLTATAVSRDSNRSTTQSQIRVRNPLDVSGPSIALSGLTPDGILQIPTEIRGTVADSNLDYWSLELSPWNVDRWREIARGESPLDNGLMTAIAPAALPNGFYRLRLKAVDMTGRADETETRFEVRTAAKTGYRTSESDLTIDVGGRSFSIIRAYDSVETQRQAGPGGASFGAGWRWAQGDFLVESNVPVDSRETLGVYEPLRDDSRTYLTLPTGQRVGFRFAPEQIDTGGLVAFRPRWIADSADGAMLETVDTPLIKANGKYYELTSGLPYNPASPFFRGAAYTVATTDGVQYSLDRSGRTSEIRMSGGVTIRVAGSSLLDAQGRVLATLLRDSSGRITAIALGSEANGPAAASSDIVGYAYDADGRLISVDRGAGESATLYSYDAAGRLILSSANGAANSIAYDPTQVTSDVVDLGSITEFSSRDRAGTAAANAQSYTLRVSAEDLQAAPSGRLIAAARLTTSGVGPTPAAQLPGALRLGATSRAGSSVAFFEIDAAGLYQLDVPAQTGAYTLRLTIAGDLNRDGAVDGADAQAFMEAYGSSSGDATFTREADWDESGAVDDADRLLLLANFGFVTGGFASSAATQSGLALEPDSDTGERGDLRTIAARATLVGVAAPGASLRLNSTQSVAKAQLNGLFAFFDTPLSIGDNDLAAVASVDSAVGNGSTGGGSSGGVGTSSLDEFTTIVRLGHETDPPSLNVKLNSDTGVSAFDRITSEPALQLSATDESGLQSLEASLDGQAWQNVLPRLSGSSLTMTRADLEQLRGSALAEGNHRLSLRGADRSGNVAAPLTF